MAKRSAGTKQAKCPVCGKPEAKPFAPFCSAGCKDRDLLKWLGEGYRLPGPAAPPDAIPDEGDDA